MSNLFKQYYVTKDESNTCVINSNKRMEEKMRELAILYGIGPEAGGGEPDADGFLQGLVAERVEVPPEETPEEKLEKAREEAKRILQQARDDADRMLNEANRKAKVEAEELRKAGYAEGMAQAAAEIEKIRANAAEESRRLAEAKAQEVAALKADYEKRADELESGIIDAIIEVFDAVFHIQFEDKKEILLHLVKNTLLHVESSKQIKIRVSEGNHHYMEANGEDIRNQLGKDVSVDIVKDMHLSGMECVIETESGVFNCGMDMELSNLLKDIRSLCI